MNLIIPDVYKTSDILATISAHMGGAAPTADTLRISVNMAISALGDKLGVHYFAPLDFTADTAAYDLSSLYIGDNAIPQISRYQSGSFEGLAYWDISDNHLRVSPDVWGVGRIISTTPAPLIPETNYVLAEHVDDAADQIWLVGRISGLPIAGWLSLAGDIWFYRGWEYRGAPDKTFLTLEAAAEVDGAAVDAATFAPVYDMPQGHYTKLLNCTRWSYNYISEVHDIGDSAEPCIAFTDSRLYDALIVSSSVNAYRAKINACASPEDKSLYSSLMANAQDEFERIYRRVRPKSSKRVIRRNPFASARTTLDAVYA